MVDFYDRRNNRVTAYKFPIVSTDPADGSIAERNRKAELEVGSVFPRRRDIRKADQARDKRLAKIKKKMK